MKHFKGITFVALLWAGLAAAAPPQSQPATIEMDVDGLVCAFCAQGIEQKLVAVALKPQQDIADDALKTLLTEAGYTLRGVRRTAEPLDAIRKRIEAK